MATNLDLEGELFLPIDLILLSNINPVESPHMIPKQSEMDGIVTKIYKAIENERHLQSTLLVLCGDHGMNEAGNHGGSSEGETSPALVFMSPKLRTISKGSECPLVKSETSFDFYRTVEQSDIAPTLAGLLAFPVPLNNLGIFIPELLYFWHEGSQTNMTSCRKKPYLQNL